MAYALLVAGRAAASGNVVALAPNAAITLIGQGAGHGVGMSQWGARGRALAGQSAAQILAAYYPGTVIVTQADDSTPIRVLLPSGQVQTLTMRDYLASVVSSELPAGFPMAAVQAQAIASRTYALWERGPQRAYDVTSTVSTQAFGAAARPDAIAAVQATSDQVLTYAGAIIPAYFHDCSVGMTENNEDVWPGPPLPYLRAIDDRAPNGVPYAQGCPRQQWQAGPFTNAEFSAILGADPRTAVGTVTALAFGARSASGRWLTVTIQGNAGSKTVTLAVFREVMNRHASAGRIVFSADFMLVGPGASALLPATTAPAAQALSFVL